MNSCALAAFPPLWLDLKALCIRDLEAWICDGTAGTVFFILARFIPVSYLSPYPLVFGGVSVKLLALCIRDLEAWICNGPAGTVFYTRAFHTCFIPLSIPAGVRWHVGQTRAPSMRTMLLLGLAIY